MQGRGAQAPTGLWCRHAITRALTRARGDGGGPERGAQIAAVLGELLELGVTHERARGREHVRVQSRLTIKKTPH